MLCIAGAVVASLLPLPFARSLGVDPAEADASEAELHSKSSADTQAGRDDTNTAETARYCLLLSVDRPTQNACNWYWLLTPTAKMPNHKGMCPLPLLSSPTLPFSFHPAPPPLLFPFIPPLPFPFHLLPPPFLFHLPPSPPPRPPRPRLLSQAGVQVNSLSACQDASLTSLHALCWNP